MPHEEVHPELDECTPLIADPENAQSPGPTHREESDAAPLQGQTRITYRLYVSHFLSTWNSRVFEFGAVLYLAAVFPGTLLPLSLYALSRGLAAIIFAPAVGHYINVGNRLQVIWFSIVFQRLAISVSCLIFYILAIRFPMTKVVKACLLATLTLLACLEKLSSVLNLVSVEKDWVVVIAGENHESLATMNAQMRRIDLICKLIGPLFIALANGASTSTAIIVNLGMNICSILVEYPSIARVYYEVPALQELKHQFQISRGESSQQGFMARSWTACRRGALQSWNDFTFYFQHRMFLPSFAGALLYLTVLSFAGQMVTWLLSAGYDSTQVAIARTVSVVFEVLATWIAPWLMGSIGPVRAGLWLASWQIICLVGGMVVFWGYATQPLISAYGLMSGTILSRIGLRGFELCAQILVQEGVEVEARGSFSSTEAAWQNLFELFSFLTTVIFPRPDQFQWPAFISVIAVCLAGFLYAIFVRIQRGHLLHLPKCISPQGVRERGLDVIIAAPNS